MLEEIEIWKSLDFMGYPDYEVSNWGQVKSFKQGREKLLKFLKGSNEYLNVRLCKNNKAKNFTVHRLVATAFIPNTENLPIINHKDENKQNNHVDNLEWCTHEYNINYGTRSKARKTKKPKTKKPKRKKILQFSLDNVFIREWETITSINLDLNINIGNICQCCKGKLKTAGGFIWRYK